MEARKDKSVKKTVKIYLCDMVHNYLGAGTYMFPLNVGYIAAYALKHYGEAIHIKIFKYPHQLLNALKQNIPDIVGFSHYTWNADLNTKLTSVVKSVSENTITVFGGPNINYSNKGIKTSE